MKAHTPGPWHLGGITNPTTGPRTSVWGPVPAGKQSGEWIAKDVSLENAPLIAVAPDLKRVLTACHHALQGYLYGNGSAILAKECADAAIEVLFRAEGR